MSVQLDDMPKPAGNSTEHHMTYHDGTTRTVYDTDIERETQMASSSSLAQT